MEGAVTTRSRFDTNFTDSHEFWFPWLSSDFVKNRLFRVKSLRSGRIVARSKRGSKTMSTLTLRAALPWNASAAECANAACFRLQCPNGTFQRSPRCNRGNVKPPIPRVPTGRLTFANRNLRCSQERNDGCKSGFRLRMTKSPPKSLARAVDRGWNPAAVRGRGGPAGEPRQDLIVATVVCPGLPRIPWQRFFARPSKWKAPGGGWRGRRAVSG